MIAEPTAIVPWDAATPDDLLVVGALFESLTRWDEDLVTRPAAASRWEPRRRGRIWRFFLRPDASFHDGTPVTAASFVRGWSQQARRGAAHHHLREVVGYGAVRAGDATTLSGVRAVDERTLDVELAAPNYDFPTQAGHPSLGPAPRAARNDPGFGDRPVGNGPFRMAEPWAHGRFVRLTRVALGAGAAPGRGHALDEVIFRIQDSEGGYIAFEQGRVDVTTVPPGALDGQGPDVRTRVYEGPGVLRGRLAATYFLVFNTRRSPFDDVAVRRAISRALDRRKIVREVFEGNAGLGVTVAPPMLPGARQRTCLACVHDPGSARRVLAEKDVVALDLWISEGGEHEAVAAQVADDLAAVGVDVTIRARPFAQYLRALRRGRPGLFRFGWALDYPTLDNALRPLFHSAATPDGGGANVARYADAEVDALLDGARASADPTRRRELQRLAEDLVVGRDQAIIPVVVLRRRTMVADRVRGLVLGPLGTTDLRAVRVLDRPTS